MYHFWSSAFAEASTSAKASADKSAGKHTYSAKIDPLGARNVYIPLLGYFIAYVPLTRVPRALFLYHYLMPLLFALVAGVLWLDGQGFFRPGSVLKQPRYYFVLLGMVIALFVVFSPLTYGFLLPRELHDMLFWLDTWR